MKVPGWHFVYSAVFTVLVSVGAMAQNENPVTAADLQTELPEQVKQGDYELRKENDSPLSQQVEDLKQAALELNRDLLILEEDLLFPANTQVAVYVSVDVGHFFKLDAVKIKIDDDMVASHLYTEKQNSALSRGGIQRIYLGNLKTGKHEVTAFFHGFGPQDREYKRAATFTLKKDQSPTMLEVQVKDSSQSMEPEFEFKEWHLQ